jgi:hypothetical protein
VSNERTPTEGLTNVEERGGADRSTGTTGVVARVDDRHNVVILDVIIVPPASTVR